MGVGKMFACSVAFYFIDVDVLIRPGDAQKYCKSSLICIVFLCNFIFVSGSSRELFVFCKFQLYRPAEGRVTE